MSNTIFVCVFPGSKLTNTSSFKQFGRRCKELAGTKDERFQTLFVGVTLTVPMHQQLTLMEVRYRLMGAGAATDAHSLVDNLAERERTRDVSRVDPSL